MKWIGQHIWDFISRFRSDVYLEDLDNSIEKCTLVVDNDGKVYKNCDRRNVTGNTVDGVITYKDDDEIKVEPGLTFKDITNYVQLEAGIDDGKGFKIKRKDTPSNGDGGHIVIEGGQASGVDNDGGAIFLTPGKSTGDASGAYVSMMGNSPAAPNSNNSTVQSNWNAAWQQATYKVEDAAWQLVNSFIQFSPNFLLSSGGIDSWGTQANHRMTIRTYAWPGNPTNFPGGPIIVEPNNNRINNTTSGDFRINTSGTNIMLTNGGYHSATNDRSEIYINSNAELTLKTFKQFGGDAHIILEPEGNIKLTPSVSVEVDGEIYLQEDHKIIFEGATSNNYETTLYVVDPTADRDINLPNASGTIALTSQLDHDTLTNYVANEHIDWTGASAGTIHATNYSNDDVSVANLKTRLGSGFQGNAVSIGDSDDTVTIPGNLTVSGTTTTINTTDLNVEDKNITLNYHATNDTSSSADGAGITIQDAVNATTDASISWNAGSDYWNFSHKASLANHTAIKGNNFWLNTSQTNRMTMIRANASVSNKTIDLPNVNGAVGVMDIFNSSYTLSGEYAQAGIYTQVTNLSMTDVYNLNNGAHDIIADSKVHSSQTMMFLQGWAYVTSPNYTGGAGVVNTANVYLQLGKTSGHGTYNKSKGFEGLVSRIGYNQASNRTIMYEIRRGGNGSSNYGLAEPGLGLKVWTNVDPSGSATSGSESISSIKLVIQYTIIPS